MVGDVSPYAIFGWPRGGVVMTPNTAANHTPSLGSDAPDDKMRAPYLEGHVRRPFCLFGHMTPHEPIWDALDMHTSPFHVDLAVDLAKTKCGECPLYYSYSNTWTILCTDKY